MTAASNAQPAAPKEIYLSDYQPFPFAVEKVFLTFMLDAHKTRVIADLTIKRLNHSVADLKLDGGPHMTLEALKVDGKELGSDGYSVSDTELVVTNVPDAFTLTMEVEINPSENTRLEGLYRSGGIFCTQCEAEGFRHIIYYPDRPDVLSVFTVRVEADQKAYPHLLSNGNPAESGTLDAGRHFAVWHDPHPKPSYLFALVAGDLAVISDDYQTSEGRDVRLNIYVRAEDSDKCDYAMGALKRSMQWDEDRFGLCYDLDVYNIVAVSDFNMGAMENKGLNVFNTKYVLASVDTATDQDFVHVEGVIGHEYFHNWTGNRVTCRDWFQLSLKEGLTVYRDQEFSSDMGSRVIKRIDDVRVLRAAQFPEDAGPLAHPVRPESYIEINNFYTATVYNKGAEVIRMMATLIGEGAFRKGMDLYFERHDGNAVTCEDFVQAMEDASGVDLGQFRLWYSQSGTPSVTVERSSRPYTGKAKAQKSDLVLKLTQVCPATPGQQKKKPMVIPVKMGFVLPKASQSSSSGDCQRAQAISKGITSLGGGQFLLTMTQANQEFIFREVTEGSVPSLLREFSAPVVLNTDLSLPEMEILLRSETDPFNRVEVSDSLMQKAITALADQHQSGQKMTVSAKLLSGFEACLQSYSKDPSLTALILSVPSENDLSNRMRSVDVEALCTARQFFVRKLAIKLRPKLQAVYQDCAAKAVEKDKGGVARGAGERRLKNLCLTYMGVTGGQAEKQLIINQFQNATCMSDEFTALQVIVNSRYSERTKLVNAFYKRWKAEELVVDKWFTAQALSSRDDCLARVEKLLLHKAFTLSNPNRMRSLVGSFAMGNMRTFHDKSGAGYRLLTQVVLKLDKINPQVAARMVTPLGRYQKLDSARQQLIKQALSEILKAQGLSKPVYEIAQKSIAGLE